MTAAAALRDLSVSALTAAVAARELDPVEVVECHLAAIDGAAGPERRDQHLSGVGARPGAGRRRRAARRDASAREGHLRHGRRADDLRIVDLQDERAGPLGRGGGARRARGCGRDRQGQPARVRLGHHEPEPALRRRPAIPPPPVGLRAARAGAMRPLWRLDSSSLGLGTDTGGSARGPSACCRVVGFKPVLGTIPTAGCFPLSATFDTVAPMARSVADCTLLYSVLSGLPLPEPHLRGLVVGVVDEGSARRARRAGSPMMPAGRARLARHAARLEDLGARLVEVELPEPTADVVAVVQAEAARSHGGLYPERRHDYGDDTRAKLDAARRVTPAAERDGRRAVEDWRRRAAAEPAVDLILCSVLGGDVPEARAREQDVGTSCWPLRDRSTSSTGRRSRSVTSNSPAGRSPSSSEQRWRGRRLHGPPDTRGRGYSIPGGGPE